MRNRAQCKLCGETIESFTEFDYVSCKCDEISITGGQKKYTCFAKNWENFLRVDDNGKTFSISVKDKDDEMVLEESQPKYSTKEDLINELARLIQYCNDLSDIALSQPVSHYELLRFLSLIVTILQRDKA